MDIIVVLNEEEYVKLENASIFVWSEKDLQWWDTVDNEDYDCGHFIEDVSECMMTLEEYGDYLEFTKDVLERTRLIILEEKERLSQYTDEELEYYDISTEIDEEYAYAVDSPVNILWHLEDFTSQNIEEHLNDLKECARKFVDCDFLFDEEVETIPKKVIELASRKK